MSTTESANNTTVPPSNTVTTTQPGETLINSNIVGHELGDITHPIMGDGGVVNSYANTAGSVKLLSVGINKQFFGKLTYEVFDFYGEGAPVDPTRVFSGETSVVYWDESSQTGVIPINVIIPGKADPTNNDGSMDFHIVLKDSKKQPLYYNFDVPNPEMVDSGVTTTTQSGGTNVYAGTTTTTTTVDPGTTTTTTPEPVTTTTTTTSTTVAPLGTIDSGGSSGAVDTTSTTLVYDPMVRFTGVSNTTPTVNLRGSSTLSPEDQQALDDLLDRARTADGDSTCPEGFERIGGVGDCVPVCPEGWERNAATGECQEPTGDSSGGTPPATNQVGSQEELLRALQTFSNIYIIQDFTVSDIINVPEGVTITGVDNPKITMSNTLVAFKITSSNVTLNGFTIHSANAGIHSMGIGVLVTRPSPDSLVSVSNINISNLAFVDIGDPIKDSYGAISVRGYNATQSSPNTTELIPVLGPGAGPFNNITINNCRFNNTANNAIDFWTVKNSKIVNCTFNGTVGEIDKADGIRGVDLQDTVISNCSFKEISQIGIRILGTKSFNVALNNNTIDSCYGIAGIMIYYGVNGATVYNNQVSNSNNGFLIRSACTSINLDNNSTNDIKEAALIISELCDNIEVINNTFSNTLGSTVVTLLQSWDIELESNEINSHLFEIGPGTAPKRGILISQSNGVSLAENKIENSYPTTDEMSCPVYFYRVFPQNPTLDNGKEANPQDNWKDFNWVDYFAGTTLVPGIVGAEAGLKYARQKITSGELIINRDSGVKASGRAWNMVPSFVSGNVDESGELIPYCIEGSAQVNDGGEGGGVVIGGGGSDDEETDTGDDSVTPAPKEKTYRLTVTNTSENRIGVNGGGLDAARPVRALVQDENGFHLTVNFMDNELQPGQQLPLKIKGNNITYSVGQIWEQNEEPRGWGTTLDVYIDEESKDGNYSGEIIFSQSASVDDDSAGQDTGTTEDYGGGDSASDDDSGTPFWPRLITVDPFIPDTKIDEYTRTPPPVLDGRTWLTGDSVTVTPGNGTWITYTELDDDNGGGFTTLFAPPTGCIEPPVPPINETTTVNPEIPVTTPPPNEECIYPAPIMPLQSNFYRVVDILNLTTTVQPPIGPPDDDIETDSEEFTPGDLVGEVVCDTNEDCNTLDY